MLVLTRKRHEEILLTPQRASDLRKWIARLPIDQERLTEGLELVEELEARETVVTVVECRSSCVKLGFAAPPSIAIQRPEVIERIRARASEPALA